MQTTLAESLLYPLPTPDRDSRRATRKRTRSLPFVVRALELGWQERSDGRAWRCFDYRHPHHPLSLEVSWDEHGPLYEFHDKSGDTHTLDGSQAVEWLESAMMSPAEQEVSGLIKQAIEKVSRDFRKSKFAAMAAAKLRLPLRVAQVYRRYDNAKRRYRYFLVRHLSLDGIVTLDWFEPDGKHLGEMVVCAPMADFELMEQETKKTPRVTTRRLLNS